MFPHFILEESLERITIAGAKDDGAELQVEACRQQHGVAGERFFCKVYGVIGHLEQGLVDDARMRKKCGSASHRDVAHYLDWYLQVVRGHIDAVEEIAAVFVLHSIVAFQEYVTDADFPVNEFSGSEKQSEICGGKRLQQVAVNGIVAVRWKACPDFEPILTPFLLCVQYVDG